MVDGDAREEPAQAAFVDDAPRAGDPVGDAPLLAAEVGADLAVVVVVGVESRVEDERVAGPPSFVGPEDAVPRPAVALVPAEGARRGGRPRSRTTGRSRAARRAGRYGVALEVGDPAPGRAAVEGARSRQRVRELLERPREPRPSRAPGSRRRPRKRPRAASPSLGRHCTCLPRVAAGRCGRPRAWSCPRSHR